MDTNDDGADSGSDETTEERLDRKWDDLIQELRVMQTGAQLTAGFLLTLPFQDPFARLDELQRDLYLVLVVLAAVTNALVMTPVAVHRRLVGHHVKQRVVMTAHRAAAAALTTISLLIVGITAFIFDVVTDRPTAIVAGGAMGVVLLALLVALPHKLLDEDD